MNYMAMDSRDITMVCGESTDLAFTDKSLFNRILARVQFEVGVDALLKLLRKGLIGNYTK